MVLCEIDQFGSLPATWAFITLMAGVAVVLMSGPLFWRYYQHPTYEMWTRKSNPNFPPPEKVRDEITQMAKGLFCAAFCPALSLYLASKKMSKGFCGTSEYGLAYQIPMFFGIWIASDFIEFLWHHCGHRFSILWDQHKPHHKFFNPTPWAVIADDYVDQFVRSSPMLIFPLLVPINMDVLVIEYGIFFYAYGIYLHWGYELDYPDAHHPVLNTAYQHYLHHAKSVNKKPYHTGFFFKIWDQMFGTTWAGECGCVKCERKRGKRTRAQWEKISATKPDYACLLTTKFWLQGMGRRNTAKAA